MNEQFPCKEVCLALRDGASAQIRTLSCRCDGGNLPRAHLAAAEGRQGRREGNSGGKTQLASG